PHPSQFETPPDPEARAARRIAVAHRLGEMGLALAEAAQRRALALMERDIAAAESGEADAVGAPKGRRDDPMLAAERMARMVRLSLALAARLDSDEPVRRTRARADAAAEREAQAEARRREGEARRAAEQDEAFRLQDTVVEVVARGLLRAGADEVELHERSEEVRERLSEGEWEFDLDERHFGAVVASLYEAMGIAPDWSVWADEPWAVEEAKINALGSPYAAGGAAWVGAGDDAPPGEPTEEAAREPVAADGSSP
ncbi:MAG: hypothetical protein ACHP7N_19645, partial [Caulobacterales bacterium]